MYSHHTFQSRCTWSHSSPARDNIGSRHVPFCGCLLSSAHGSQSNPEDLIAFLSARRGKGNEGLCVRFFDWGDCGLQAWTMSTHFFVSQLLVKLSHLEGEVGNWRIRADWYQDQNIYSLPCLHCLPPPPHRRTQSCQDTLYNTVMRYLFRQYT